jgi:hypothetical protein
VARAQSRRSCSMARGRYLPSRRRWGRQARGASRCGEEVDGEAQGPGLTCHPAILAPGSSQNLRTILECALGGGPRHWRTWRTQVRRFR